MGYHRILVAFDESQPSGQALDEAIRLARASGARLRLLHVMDELEWTNGYETAQALVDDVLPRMRKAGEELLAIGCRKATEAEVETESSLVVGESDRVWSQVARESARWHADLVVVGTHGRQGLDRFLLGSDAEQIVRHVAAPVLVVRAAEASRTGA